jgi:glycosyltransferase involved in cell wall biosynthesis
MKYAKQKGLVSIIVPIYNTPEVNLRECLDSILAQTFTNWEAILVNDGSTGSTEKIIDEYAEKDSRFIAVHKQNEGTLLSRKAGLENSKGEFIANIDHDDIYDLQFLEKMYAKINETNADFVYCDHNNGGNISQLSDYEWSTDISANLACALSWQELTLLTWDKLIRREVYTKVCFPDAYLTFLEDQVQMVQVIRHSKSAAFVPECLYFRKLGGLSSVLKPVLVVKGTIIMKNILEDFFNVLPENVKKIFYNEFAAHAFHCYYLLDKKTRAEFKNDLEPLLPEVIKIQTRLNLKICLFLASKGIEFPITLRDNMIVFRDMLRRKW